jgi:hypothetical protein
MRSDPSLILSAILLAAYGFAAPALADDDDYPVWKPSNGTAISVTGPIIMLPDRLKAGQVDFPWQPDGVVAQFKPDQGPIPARIFQVTQTTSPQMLNGAKLCGERPVNWIVMVPSPPNGLEIDAYSAADKPSTITSPGLCGTFSYTRW